MLRSDAPHHTHWLRGSESAKAHVFETPLDDALCPVLLQTRAANLLDSIRTACAFWRVLLVLSSRQAFLQVERKFHFFRRRKPLHGAFGSACPGYRARPWL